MKHGEHQLCNIDVALTVGRQCIHTLL
jgi:hypothetical protein